MVEAIETEGDVIQVDLVLGNIEKLTKKLDDMSEPTTRDLLDLLQDEFLPNLKMLAEDTRVCAGAVVRHEDAIADLEEADTQSQLLPEDAEKILAFCEKAVEIFKAQRAEAKKQHLPVADQYNDLITLGEGVIEAVKELVIEEEEEEETN